MDESLKDRSIWIRGGVGRKAQWGRLTGKTEESKHGTIYWAERSYQGGIIPLLRSDFVLKRKNRDWKAQSLPATGKVSKRGLVDRGRL